MRLFYQRVLLGVFCVALVALVCGCPKKEKGITVKGKLVKDGQPVQVDITGRALPPGETGRIKVTFYPVKSDNEVIVDGSGEVSVAGGEPASVESDGTFYLGGGGKGPVVKPGKYRIVITHPDPSGGKDLLKGAFNEANSKITRDVKGDDEVVIDLGKPTG